MSALQPIFWGIWRNFTDCASSGPRASRHPGRLVASDWADTARRGKTSGDALLGEGTCSSRKDLPIPGRKLCTRSPDGLRGWVASTPTATRPDFLLRIWSCWPCRLRFSVGHPCRCLWRDPFTEGVCNRAPSLLLSVPDFCQRGYRSLALTGAFRDSASGDVFAP